MRLRILAAVVGVMPAIGLGVWAVHEAYAACSIHFNNAFDAWDTNSAGSFGPYQTPPADCRVDYNSSGVTYPWYLVGSETPGNSKNLATQGCSPDSFKVEGSGEDHKAFTINGSLDNKTMDGLYQLSCFDGTYVGCVGAHNIDILHP
jgi:hypothetical protein